MVISENVPRRRIAGTPGRLRCMPDDTSNEETSPVGELPQDDYRRDLAMRVRQALNKQARKKRDPKRNPNSHIGADELCYCTNFMFTVQ